MDCSTPGLPVHHQLPELAQTHVHWVQWCYPTISSSVVPFSSCLPSFPASGSFNESVLRIRWSKYWSFSFSLSPSNEYSGLISFRMYWLDLLAVQATPLTKKVENEVSTANTTRGKASRETKETQNSCCAATYWRTKERPLMSSLSRLLRPQRDRPSGTLKNHSNTTAEDNDKSPETKLEVMEYGDPTDRECKSSHHEEIQWATRKLSRAA